MAGPFIAVMLFQLNQNAPSRISFAGTVQFDERFHVLAANRAVSFVVLACLVSHLQKIC